MSLETTLQTIFGGIFAVLAVATLVGRVLAAAIKDTKPNPVITNLNQRIGAWWWISLFVGTAIWAGNLVSCLLFALVSFQCLREYMSITYTRRGDHRAMLWSFFFFLPLQYYFVATNWYGMHAIFIPVYGFLLLPISASLGSDPSRFLERTTQVQWGLMTCVYCLSYIPALQNLTIAGFESKSPLLILYLIVVVQASDVLQYVWGKLFGKHKLAPNISPSKTLEGLLGGVLSASLVGALLWRITPFTPLQAAAISLTITTLGFFGGFVLSAIKRDRRIKDWGTIIEGHGGMLDRVDSLCFSAPVFFHIVRYFWA